MVEQLYQIIKNACPSKDEVIHLVTLERDLSAPDAGKNRLTAEFSTLILTELRKKIAQNNDSWKVELDRVFAIKQRTSRAESYSIHRIAQQPLMLYQSRNTEEKITPREKVIIVDDHIQANFIVNQIHLTWNGEFKGPSWDPVPNQKRKKIKRLVDYKPLAVR